MGKPWSEQKNKDRNDTETESTTYELRENNINELYTLNYYKYIHTYTQSRRVSCCNAPYYQFTLLLHNVEDLQSPYLCKLGRL